LSFLFNPAPISFLFSARHHSLVSDKKKWKLYLFPLQKGIPCKTGFPARQKRTEVVVCLYATSSASDTKNLVRFSLQLKQKTDFQATISAEA